MVLVFGVFALMPIIDMKEMGIGLAAAILIDATIVRAVLLPATMKLLGAWNWYLPRWLEWLPRLEHERSVRARAAAVGGVRPPNKSAPVSRAAATTGALLRGPGPTCPGEGARASRGSLRRAGLRRGSPSRAARGRGAPRARGRRGTRATSACAPLDRRPVGRRRPRTRCRPARSGGARPRGARAGRRRASRSEPTAGRCPAPHPSRRRRRCRAAPSPAT